MIHHPECRFSVVPGIQNDEAVPDHQQVLQSNLGTVARDPDGNAIFGEGSASETGAINSDSYNPTAPFASAQPPSSWLFTRSCCTAQHCSGSCFSQFFATTRVRDLRTRKQLVRRVVEGQGPGLSWAEESADGLADFPSIPSRTNSQVQAKRLRSLPRLSRVQSRGVLYGGKFMRRRRDWKRGSSRRGSNWWSTLRNSVSHSKAATALSSHSKALSLSPNAA